jgi:hypothetical protein
MNNKGFIKINRKLFSHPFWKKQRVYSEAEAWIDLIQSARFDGTTEFINNKLIDLERGDIPVSIRFNANRWSWGEMKVRNFFNILEKQAMITQRQHSGQRILTLVNYGVYNDKEYADNTENNTPTTQQQHSNNTATTQNKRNKEIKNIIIKEEEEVLPIGKPPPLPKLKYVLDIKKILESELPFTSEIFKENLEKLLKTKNWQKKPESAVELALKKMKKYDENFINQLIENAIIGGWQGLFFPNTDENYKKYLNGNQKGNSNFGGQPKKGTGEVLEEALAKW